MPAYLWPTLIYLLVLALHLVVPARWVDGYVRDRATGRKLRYRLNGLRVMILVVAAWAIACQQGWMAWDAFYEHRW